MSPQFFLPTRSDTESIIISFHFRQNRNQRHFYVFKTFHKLFSRNCGSNFQPTEKYNQHLRKNIQKLLSGRPNPLWAVVRRSALNRNFSYLTTKQQSPICSRERRGLINMTQPLCQYNRAHQYRNTISKFPCHIYVVPDFFISSFSRSGANFIQSFYLKHKTLRRFQQNSRPTIRQQNVRLLSPCQNKLLLSLIFSKTPRIFLRYQSNDIFVCSWDGTCSVSTFSPPAVT